MESTQIATATDGTTPYPSGSWGLGIVVPEGSQLQGGGYLSWEDAKNVTAVVTLPSINQTDNAIYAILSAMAGDGSVLQIAAGICPNMTEWLAYGFLIRNLQAIPQNYTWVLNSSKPEMNPGATVTLSIYLSSNVWEYLLQNTDTKASVSGRFSANIRPTFKPGDQEIFALESYSDSRVAFENMGSLLLDSLLVDGQRVARGWYYYGDWDSAHNPLFVVGGLSPPPFLSVQRLENNTIAWSYNEWNDSQQPLPAEPIMIPLGLAAIVLATSILVITLEVRKRTA